jgi:hypothetical protein
MVFSSPKLRTNAEFNGFGQDAQSPLAYDRISFDLVHLSIYIDVDIRQAPTNNRLVAESSVV